MFLSFSNVKFIYDSAPDPLFDCIDMQFPVGWTGIVGANGTGKTTILLLACRELDPCEGRIYGQGRVVYCPQRTDDPPSMFAEFMTAVDGEACSIRGKLGIDDDWLHRWETLSHGERKRVQIAAALWQEPDILAVDEPTNHIDSDARKLLMNALSAYNGIGLLVSHDREMLDTLCTQCLFIDPPDVVMRHGSFTEASEQIRLEEDQLRDEYDQAKSVAEKLRRESIRRHEEASRAAKRSSKRGISPRDHDAKGKIDHARVTGADGNAGRIASQLDGRVRQSQEHLSQIKIKKRYDMDFWLPGSRSMRNTLFDIPSGRIDLGECRHLVFPDLAMQPDDRIAITGPNGAGKSTLIRYILDRLNLPSEKIVYLPQEIDQAASREIMSQVNSLSRDELGQVMTIVSCLGSRPERLIGSSESSPGEIRKILLAMGVARAPHLIIMDEPTNHLDLPAIQCLEDALAGCPCGLLLVSHDHRFLGRLAKIRWHISADASDPETFNLNIAGI